MKQFIIGFILLAPASVFAGSSSHSSSRSSSISSPGAYGSAGCGLGSLAFHDQPGTIQIVAATLNGTGVQTFGITSGTSNCNDGHNLLKAYIETNHDAIKTAAARGQGEAIVGLAKVMNCSDAFELSQALKSNYKKVFQSNDVEQTIQNIDGVIQSDSSLKATCQA